MKIYSKIAILWCLAAVCAAPAAAAVGLPAIPAGKYGQTAEKLSAAAEAIGAAVDAGADLEAGELLAGLYSGSVAAGPAPLVYSDKALSPAAAETAPAYTLASGARYGNKAAIEVPEPKSEEAKEGGSSQDGGGGSGGSAAEATNPLGMLAAIGLVLLLAAGGSAAVFLLAVILLIP